MARWASIGSSSGSKILLEITLRADIDIRLLAIVQLVGADSALEGQRLFLGRSGNQIRSNPCKWHKARHGDSGLLTA